MEFAFLIFIWLYPGFAYADSDGYYCQNTNYIAYEFDGWITGKEEGHNLYIHFLSDDSPLDNPAKVELKRFQTQGMKCSKSEIEIRAWEALYTIDLKNRSSPQIIKTEKLPNINELPLQGKNSSNLGAYGSSGALPIETASERYKYTLEIGVVSDNQVAEKGYIFHHIETNLVRQTADGKTFDKYEIFKSVREESVH